MVLKDGRNGLGYNTSPLKVIDSKDGHVYYLINADQHKGVCNTVFLEKYASLRQQTDRSGLFFVADASDDPSGTVHQGWAVYIWDELHGKWIKIAEQETVDGIWGIDEELLSKYLTKVEFNDFLATQYNVFVTNTTNAITDLTSRVEANEENIAILLRCKHTHENKTVLDALTDKYGDIYYNNQRLGGNSYLYKQKPVDGHLVWVDPTYTGTTPFTPVPCRNSQQIANEFVKTSLAYAGLVLIVPEVDGSITTFRISEAPHVLSDFHPVDDRVTQPMSSEPAFKSNENLLFMWADSWTLTSLDQLIRVVPAAPTCASALGICDAVEQANLVNEDRRYSVYEGEMRFGHEAMFYAECKYIATYECTNLADPTTKKALTSGVVNSVKYLPTADLALVNRGLFCPRWDDGQGHPADHIYRCNEKQVDGVWVAYWKDLTPGELESVCKGANITSCWIEEHSMWKKARITWSDPEVEYTNDYGKYYFESTTLVRKFGSAPTHVGDGTVVCVATRNQYQNTPFVDWVPYSEDQVFYKVFSKTTVGRYYFNNTNCSAEAKLMTWEYIQSALTDGKGTLLLSVGDTIVLPEHTVYGEIECEVTRVGSTFIEVSSRDAICKKCIDAVEDAYIKTTDSSVDTNKQYVRRVVDADTGNVSYEDYSGTPSTAELASLYEPNTGDDSRLNSDGSVKGGVLHGSTSFLQSNLYQWLNAKTDNWFVKKSDWDVAPSYANEKGFAGNFVQTLPGILSNVTFTIPSSSSNHTQSKHLEHSIASVDWHLSKLNSDGNKFVSGLTTGGSDKFPEEEIGVVLQCIIGVEPTDE